MIELSDHWAPRLSSQPESGMGYQIATVVLKDGRRFECVTVVDGVITKVDGIEEIPFTEREISDIVVTHGRR